jgi:hypothetical protein
LLVKSIYPKIIRDGKINPIGSLMQKYMKFKNPKAIGVINKSVTFKSFPFSVIIDEINK